MYAIRSYYVYVNEINTIPGSLSFYLWEATGLTFDQLVDRLIDLAFKQKRENDGLVHTYSENIFSFSGSSMKLGKKFV